MRRAELTYREFFGSGGKDNRHSPRDLEHRLQTACVRWFRMQHPTKRHNLFAVPNGGHRTITTAARLKAEGVLKGVADLILLYPAKGYHALLIELKTAIGRQSEAQKEWQRKIEADGYKYVVVRSIDDFIGAINEYLGDTTDDG